MKPTKHKFTVLKQICELIPRNLVHTLAKKHGVDKKSRTFKPWSHVVALVFTQLSHALSLNDVSDTLRNHSGVLTTIRRATPPSRNGLSYANRERNADMAEELFWKMMDHLKTVNPKFGAGKKYSGFPRRFKRVINVVDSTTIQLVSNCIDWAKHRRRKAAAKCHMRLDLETFLPRFAIVRESKGDASEAKELCAGMQAGEIVIFDKAYVDYDHLFHLDSRGIFWITRAKDNMAYKVLKSNPVKGNVISDQEITLVTTSSQKKYTKSFRLIRAKVEINGKMECLSFITNNINWAASSICDLYKARWAIEVFFKQMKQTLQLADFLGHSKQAVRWQIWTALLTYVLLRFIAFQSKWKGTFARLFTILRGTLWSTLSMFSILDCCGTAGGNPKVIARPAQAYLPGFVWN